MQNLQKWYAEFAKYVRKILIFFGTEFWQPYCRHPLKAQLCD